MTTTLVILMPYISPNSTLTPCSKTMSRGDACSRTALGVWALYYALAALKHFYRDGWLPTLFKVLLLILLNAVLITPILFAIIALRM